MGYYSIDGLDAVTKFFTEKQINDKGLWKSLVRQFKDKTDSPHNDGYHGEYWGKVMRGAVLIYKYTSDESLYKTLEETVRDLLAVRESDGRISSFSRQGEFKKWDVWCRKYVCVGLEYFLEICKDEALKKEIITALKGHADYIISKIGIESGKIPITSTSNFWQGLNSSSIMKSFVVLYEITGDERYLDFAKYILYTGFTKEFNTYNAVKEGKLRPAEFDVRKIYEMISCFEGVLELYKVTKVKEYLEVCQRFESLIAKYELTIVGGSGCDLESFNDSAVAQLKKPRIAMQETCVTVSLIIFYNELFKATYNHEYLWKMEIAYRNAYLGALNNMGGPARYGFPVDSYAELIKAKRGVRRVGGCLQIEPDRRYGCCLAISSAGVGVYAESAINITNNIIYVNHYVSGRFQAVVDGELVKININTPKDAFSKAIISIETTIKRPLDVVLIKPFKDAGIKSLSADTAKVFDSFNHIYLEGFNPAKHFISVVFDIPFRIVKKPIDEKYGIGWYAITRGYTAYAVDKRYSSLPRLFVGNPEEIKVEERAPIGESIYSATAEIDGEKVTLIDYASAGKTFDEHSEYSVWMPYSEKKGMVSRIRALAMSTIFLKTR